jgi:hypothetical protein
MGRANANAEHKGLDVTTIEMEVSRWFESA